MRNSFAQTCNRMYLCFYVLKNIIVPLQLVFLSDVLYSHMNISYRAQSVIKTNRKDNLMVAV